MLWWWPPLFMFYHKIVSSVTPSQLKLPDKKRLINHSLFTSLGETYFCYQREEECFRYVIGHKDKKNVCKRCYKYFIDWFQLLIDFKIWHLTKYIHESRGKKVALEAFMNLCVWKISHSLQSISQKRKVLLQVFI